MKLRLWPTWCHSPWFGRSSWFGRCSGPGSHTGLLGVRQNGAVVVFVLGQQWGDFTQFFCRLLQQFYLLTQLGKLGLLTPQNLMNVLHTTPCCEFKDTSGNGQR